MILRLLVFWRCGRRRHRIAERLGINRRERTQIKVDDPRIGALIEDGRVSRQDEEIARAGGRNVTEPDRLASEFRYIPSLNISVIGRHDPEDGNRKPVVPAIMHETRFGFRRAGHVDRDDDRPFQALGGMNSDERDGLLLGVRSSSRGGKSASAGRGEALTGMMMSNY